MIRASDSIVKLCCVVGLAMAAVLAGCVRTGSEEFLTPEILSAEAKVLGVGEARLSCTLSEPRAERVGFAYAEAGAPLVAVECRLEGASFELKLKGLAPGATYEWYAFAAAGESELRSETARFTFDPLPPEELVAVPDPVFKAYLTDHFDVDGDGEISLSEALRVRKIAVKTDDIFSLEGIGYFKNIDTLICRGVDMGIDEYSYEGHPGRLDELDLSANTRLRRVECDGNIIKTLVLPDSQSLEFLRCSRNMLEELDLTGLPYLRLIQAFENDLTSLDFSGNPRMESVMIGGNPIASIDVTCCPKLSLLNVAGFEIKELDLSGCPMLEWLGIYATNLSSIDLSFNPKLRKLYCSETGIASLDLKNCTNLSAIECWKCQIEELDVSMLPNLESLRCAPMNTLKKLYVSESQVIPGVTYDRSEDNVPAETEIVVRYAGTPDGKIAFEDPNFKAFLVRSFDWDKDGEISVEEAAEIAVIEFCSSDLNVESLQGIEYMPNLEVLRCPGEWIATQGLDRTNYYLSKHYHFDGCVGPIGTLKYVDVSRNPKLRVLQLYNNSGLGETGSGSVDVSNCPELEELSLQMCYIKYPDVSGCPELRILNLGHGRGVFPDLSGNPKLESLVLDFEQSGRMQALDISRCPHLEELNVGGSISSLSDLSFNTRLRSLKYGWCVKVSPDLSAVPLLEVLDCQSTDISSLDLSAQKHLRELTVSGNPLRKLDLRGQEGLMRLQCASCRLTELDVSGLKDLDYLECQDNNLSSVDFSGNPRLREVYMQWNPLTSIDVSKNAGLDKLYLCHTGITELDVSHNPLLWDLRCESLGLESLDVSSCRSLCILCCGENRLTTLDISGNIYLEELDCRSNALEGLGVSNSAHLRYLVCGNNYIRSLDVSHNPRLSGPNDGNITGLYCAPMDDGAGMNLLETLYLASGQSIDGVTVNRSTKHVPEGTKLIFK